MDLNLLLVQGTPIMVGEPQQHELEQAGHITSVARKQRAMNVRATQLPFYIYSPGFQERRYPEQASLPASVNVVKIPPPRPEGSLGSAANTNHHSRQITAELHLQLPTFYLFVHLSMQS